MIKRFLILSVVGLAAGWHAAAEAHERCGYRTAYVTPTCYAATPCTRSSFRITRLRTITISSTSSSPGHTSPVISYSQLRCPIRYTSQCGIYTEQR